MRHTLAAACLIGSMLASPVNAAMYMSGPDGSNCIALTFDDGPDPELTPAILDLLDAEDVVATFFLVGEHVVAAPDIVRRIAADGHEIGNHSWSHPLLPRLSDQAIASQFAMTDAAIFDAVGFVPTIARPPKGAYDPDVIREAGRPVIIWGATGLDWRLHNATVAARLSLSRASSGLIVLLHDTFAVTLEETRLLIDGFRAAGYGFATVSDLLAGATCSSN